MVQLADTVADTGRLEFAVPAWAVAASADSVTSAVMVRPSLMVFCLVCACMCLFLGKCAKARVMRSEEHTSELQSLMRISYAVFCLKKKKKSIKVSKRQLVN